MGPIDLLIRLGVAALLGSASGLDRQRLDKSAGLRTHMLVCVASALFMIVSAFGFDRVLDPGRIALDPSRVAAQIVTGIGFLGAGTIVVRKGSVHGLTTAASIWAVAAVGMAAGGALYLAAIATTVILLVILAVLKPLEDRMSRSHIEDRPATLNVTGSFVLDAIEGLLHGAAVPIEGIRVRDGERPGERENPAHLRADAGLRGP
jgi:putative Mg2+ transporter-C (MgtC) family protein